MTTLAAGWWGVLAVSAIAAEPARNIVGGQDAPEGSWPDAVAFVVDEQVVCTGTLIASDVVLTAGHCLPALGDNAVRAIVGEVVWEDGVGVAIAATGAHPLAEGGLDAAWVRLAEDVEGAPRALPRACDAAATVDGGKVWLVGYGTLDSAGQIPSTRLQQAASTLQDSMCTTPTRGCRTWDEVPVELLAGGDGVDACVGDSGGPLYLSTPDGPVLIGVASRSALGATRSCGDGGIYTRVDAVQDWLSEAVGTAPGGEPCASGDDETVGDAGACACQQGGGQAPAWWMLAGLVWRRRR